jgi:hypothetical protein
MIAHIGVRTPKQAIRTLTQQLPYSGASRSVLEIKFTVLGINCASAM